MSKRHSKGEGTFRKRSDGLWEWQVMIGYHENGKRNLKSFYGKSKKEAKEKGLAVLFPKEDTKSTEVKPDIICFSEWADTWYEHMKNRVSATTYESYAYTLRVLKEYYKDIPLTNIKAMQIEEMLEYMQLAGKSQSYLSKLRGMMFQIMRKAEANELINKNPVPLADKIRAPRIIGEAPQRDSFTKEEIVKLMRELPDTRIGWSIRLMIGTGMRTQEILALKPMNISPDGSRIDIHQAVVMNKGTAEIGPTKSVDSYRTVPVPFSLRQYAIKLRTTFHEYCWYGPRTPLTNPSTFRDQFKEALEGVEGVRILTPHCCRHTYVSQLQAAGTDIDTIRILSGHAQIEMTQHYLHVQENVKEDAVKALDLYFAS